MPEAPRHRDDNPTRRVWVERPATTTFDPMTSTLVVDGGLFDEIEIEAVAAAIRATSLEHTRSIVVDLSATQLLPSRAISHIVQATRQAARHGTTLQLIAATGTLAHRALSAVGIPVATATRCTRPSGW